MGVDNRLANGAALFGSLSCNFPSSDKTQEVDTADAESLNRHLEYDIKRQCWTMGLAPQTYAQQIKIPVYIVNSANSARVDIENVEKMKSRLNGSCRYLVLPTAVDYISDKYFEGLVKWLKGTAVTTNKPLTSALDANGEYCIKIQTSSSINKTSLWYCVNPRGSARHWRSAKLTREGDCYVAKPDFYEKENEIIAFALFDKDVATSTALFYDKVTVNRPKIVNKNIFSGNGNQYLINLPVNGGSLNLDLEQKLTEGYLGIVGAKGRALCTFAVSDAGICKNSSIALGFDICCDVKQTLTVTAIAKFGEKNEQFRQQVSLDGNGKWQRVTIERENFRRVEDGKQISEGDIIDAIIISADDIVVNNMFLV